MFPKSCHGLFIIYKLLTIDGDEEENNKNKR